MSDQTTEGKTPQQNQTEAQEPQTEGQQENQQQQPESTEQKPKILTRDWSKVKDILQQEQPGNTGATEALHPIVKKMQSFLSEGRTKEEVASFLRLQSMDMGSMGYDEAIKTRMKMESPGLTDADVEAILEDKYGVLDPNADDYEAQRRRVVAKMKLEGNEAKNWLRDQMMPLDNPEAEKRAKEQERIQERTKKAWGTVTQDLINNIKVQHTHSGKGIGGGEYSFEYEPKLDEGEAKQLQSAMVNYAMQNGLDFDDRSLPELSQFRDKMLWAMKPKDIMNAALEDMYASLTSYYLKNRTPGIPGNKTRQGSRSESAPKKRPTAVGKGRGKFI